jgi:hypothetical protein
LSSEKQHHLQYPQECLRQKTMYSIRNCHFFKVHPPGVSLRHGRSRWFFAFFSYKIAAVSSFGGGGAHHVWSGTNASSNQKKIYFFIDQMRISVYARSTKREQNGYIPAGFLLCLFSRSVSPESQNRCESRRDKRDGRFKRCLAHRFVRREKLNIHCCKIPARVS